MAAALLALAAVAVLILTNQGNKKSTAQSALAAATVYQQKLSDTLTPIVNDNLALSKALQAIDGSKSTLRAATNATQDAQAATVAARGAVAILTVPVSQQPVSQQPVSQQAAQALTQESGYLQAVASTLSDPLGSAPSSLQPLASATSSAFVPLANVAPGASASIYGIDNLQKWVSGAKAAAKRGETPTIVTVPGPTTTVVGPSGGGTQSAPDGGTASSSTRAVNDTRGRPTMTAGSNISDAFARNVLIAAADYFQSNGVIPDGVSLSVSSPVTGSTYSVTYSYNGSTVTAWIYDGSTANTIMFPDSDANGTG